MMAALRVSAVQMLPLVSSAVVLNAQALKLPDPMNTLLEAAAVHYGKVSPTTPHQFDI